MIMADVPLGDAQWIHDGPPVQDDDAELIEPGHDEKWAAIDAEFVEHECPDCGAVFDGPRYLSGHIIREHRDAQA